MPITKKTRQSSLRATAAISRLAHVSSSGEESVDEHASELSGSAYESNSQSGSTTTSPTHSSLSDSKSSESGEEEEASSRCKRITRVSVNPASTQPTIETAKPPPKSRLPIHPGQIQRTNSSCPLYRYLASCRERQMKLIREIAIDYFSQSIESLRFAFVNAVHPFDFLQGSTFKDEYTARQGAMFPTSFYWLPYSFDDKLGCLPGPPVSPLIVPPSSDTSATHENTGRRLRRFEFDKEHNLLYVGGFVKTLAWCPLRLYSENIFDDNMDPVYLAIATYPSPGTRVFYSDPVTNSHGLVQIWNCGHLTLSNSPGGFQPEPHLFIAHDWGLVIHMCWLPLSVTLAARMSKEVAQQFKCPAPRIAPSPLIHRTLGHLIIACQDGLVRVVSIPRFLLDPIYFDGRRNFPLYQLNPKAVLKLSPCATKQLDWVGWPTRLHIRPQYPNRLFVGYSTGYVAYYDLSCLNPLLFNASECHLAPVRLFRLINGPVRSLSLNVTNGRMLLVQGWDANVRVWDIEDTVSNTIESPELCWYVSHGIPGNEVLWHSRGDMIFCSREANAPRRCLLGNLADWTFRSDSLLGYTFLEAPVDSVRSLIPLGIQCVTHLDFSEPLNTLLCANNQGRAELILCSLDGRTKTVSKFRYLSQLRISLCQWTMNFQPVNDVVLPRTESVDELCSRLVASKCYLLPTSAATVPAAISTTSRFTDSTCEACLSDRSFCWHKLWSHGKLTLNTGADIPSRPYTDYLKTPFLSITQAAFCPSPTAANWIAAGSACGFVHFHCVESLYLSEFDQMLNRPPSGKDSPYFSIPTKPATKPSHIRIHKKARRTTHGAARGESRKRSSVRIDNGTSETDSCDSDATEAMVCDMDNLDAATGRHERCARRDAAKKLLQTPMGETVTTETDCSSDQTEPCLNGIEWP